MLTRIFWRNGDGVCKGGLTRDGYAGLWAVDGPGHLVVSGQCGGSSARTLAIRAALGRRPFRSESMRELGHLGQRWRARGLFADGAGSIIHRSVREDICKKCIGSP